jgi:hypothetical protein
MVIVCADEELELEKARDLVSVSLRQRWRPRPCACGAGQLVLDGAADRLRSAGAIARC